MGSLLIMYLCSVTSIFYAKIKEVLFIINVFFSPTCRANSRMCNVTTELCWVYLIMSTSVLNESLGELRKQSLIIRLDVNWDIRITN